MEYPNWNGAIGTYFVHKRGENYWCGYHKIYIEPVTVLGEEGKVEQACQTCIEEEEGNDILEATIGIEESITPVPKTEGICTEPECFEPAKGKCLRCREPYCGQHLYLPRVWCTECHDAVEIDLDMDIEEVVEEKDIQVEGIVNKNWEWEMYS